MEGFSENLDDGELWLPSDIFPVEDNKFTNSSFCCCCYSCLYHNDQGQAATASDENIIRRFAAISLLQQRHTVPKPFPITERFRPAERCISCTDYSLSECFERNRGARQLLQTGPPPVYQPVPLYPPVQLQLQVESLMEARARVLQMQAEKNQFIRMHSMRKISGLDRFAGNRFLPFGGSGNGESSSGRDYGGTGVFLPRVHTTNINNNGGKRRGGRNRQDVQQTGQRYPCI